MRRTLLICGLMAVASFAIAIAAPPAEKRPGGRLVLPAPQATQKKPQATVLVKVNGEPITVPDLQWGFELQKVSIDQRQTRQREVLERLIDNLLIRQFLKSRKIKADPEEVADRLERLKIALGLAPDAGKKAAPARTSAAYAFDEERVRQEIDASLAWQKYLDVAASNQTIRDHFAKSKSHFDGTELRASHIVLLVAIDRDSQELRDAEAKLRTLRNEILHKKITFAEAAGKHSQGPSKEQGGDIGYFPHRGKMPAAFCDVAFSLKEGEISQPFRTPFGVHLCVVTARKPGELSLEDARPAVARAVAAEIRHARIAELRAKAKIEWIPATDQQSPSNATHQESPRKQ